MAGFGTSRNQTMTLQLIDTMSTERNFTCVEHEVPCTHIRQYPRATSTHQGEVLHLAVKQYKPRYEPHDGDVTVLACHASAFPKELYEPIWSRMMERAEQNSPGRRIRSIFIADVSNQGQSGILNEQKLGNEPSYYDHARDYLSMVNHLRHEMTQPIVGFGHSMGGNVIVNLALLHPRLLTTVVAIEPVINTSPAEMNFIGTFPLTIKKDRWQSKDAAMASIVKSPFYAKWDPRVLDLYREHGLRMLPTYLYPSGQLESKDNVTLTTSKHQEALSFARAAFPTSLDQPLETFVPTTTSHPDLGADRHPKNAFYRPESTMTFQQLPFLRPSCFYIYGGKSHMASAHEKGRKEKLAATGIATGGSGGAARGKVKDVVVEASHFAPFENPELIAELAGRWYDSELDRWRSETDEEERAIRAIPHQKRSLVTEDWTRWVHKLWGKKPSADVGRDQKAKPHL